MLLEAGSPDAVVSCLLFDLLRRRVPAVRIVLREGRVQLLDPATGHRIERHEHACPGRFTTGDEFARVFARLREEAGGCDRGTLGTSVFPPRVHACVRFTRLGECDVRIDFDYSVPLWRWRLRRWYQSLRWRLGPGRHRAPTGPPVVVTLE